MGRHRTIPGDEITRDVLLGSAWLAFIYLLLLTLFELIELVRPKPAPAPSGSRCERACRRRHNRPYLCVCPLTQYHSTMLKTAVTVLQEMMIKIGQVPEYECISQSGPQHQATFEYRCVAKGVVVTASARSKKEAKQEVARRMLLQLHACGMPVPQSFAASPDAEPGHSAPPKKPTLPALPALEAGSGTGTGKPGALDTRSYVAVLRELCEEYRLGEATYDLVGDTGPPHQRHFTVRAALGLHSRTATATTKKQARQLAAEQLYTYLRENLARLTKDFVEEEALQRAQEKSMKRARVESALARLEFDAPAAPVVTDGPWRPDLGQCVAQYQHGLRVHLGDEVCSRGLEALKLEPEGEDPEEALQRVCDELGLRVEHLTLGATVSVVRLMPTSPPLSFGAQKRRAAAAAALRYLGRTLPLPAPHNIANAFAVR